MRNSALHDGMGLRTLGLVFVVLMVTVIHQQLADAQSCAVPLLKEPKCADGSVDGYKQCYSDLYDHNVISAFESMAKCSHVKASKGIGELLEASATLVTGVVQKALKDIDEVINAKTGSPLTCIGDLNAVRGTLQSFIDAERDARDLSAYRRSTYTPAHFSFFESTVLAARQNRAICDVPLQKIRKQLVLLSKLKAQHPDYCQILRDSAKYESVSKIDGLAEWTAMDPSIHFDAFFNFSITLNAQCGYYDFSSGGQAAVRNTSCSTLTTEYKQTLSAMDGALGWLAQNRDTIVATSTAVAATIFSLAGSGASAGPYGAAVGAVVGLIIAGIEYFTLQSDIDSLKDLIAEKQQAVRDVVAKNLITEAEFNDLATQACTPWRPAVEHRVDAMLGAFDFPKHLEMIDSYYKLSDNLHNWYNELFLWATTPGADGTSFLDSVATQDLLAQRNQFDQRIFGARADQEVAAENAALTNIKGTVTQLTCSNLPPPQRRSVRGKLNAGVNGFNGKCKDIMEALAVQLDQPVAFTDSTIASDVVCAYKGFRNGIASLEIRNGQGATSNMTVKDTSGGVVGQLSNISSATDFSQIATLPGFSCTSANGHPFGVSTGTRLAEATYPFRLQDNTFGFDEGKAATMRSAIQTLDGQLRLKVITCSRQLGNTAFNLPRTAETCGIPQSF